MKISRNNIGLIFILSMSFFVSACAETLTHTQIKELRNGVYGADGINKEEAVIIAQNFVIESQLWDRLTTLKPYRINERTVWFHKGRQIVYAIAPKDRTNITIEQVWILYFRDKRNSAIDGALPIVPFRVVIDAETGQVISYGLDKLGEKYDVNRTRTYSDTQRL